ncbi:hypothetical protein [Alicyclobacillus fructus]|uniref:hypothetical protein n=1 Tax=Alicyclobacillus fructus TaxID=2816082 RepID=UPI001A8D0CF9|nr:hypothetical protein [Alicyclobacillus fructus]
MNRGHLWTCAAVVALSASLATGCGHSSAPPDRWTVYNKWLYSVVSAPGGTVNLQVDITNPHNEKRLALRGATLESNALQPVAKVHMQASQTPEFYQYLFLWTVRAAGEYQGEPVRLHVNLANGEQSFDLGKAYTRVAERPVSWLDIRILPGGESGELANTVHDFDMQFVNSSGAPIRLLGLETAGGFQFSKTGFELNQENFRGGYPPNVKPLPSAGFLIPPHATCNVYAEFKQPSGYLNDLIQVAAVLERGGVRGEEIVGPAMYTVNYFLNDDPSAYYPALNVTS